MRTALALLALAWFAGAQEPPAPRAAAEVAGQEPAAPVPVRVRELPACTLLDGAALDWAELDGRALLLYFHRPGLDYADRALRELVDRLAAEPQLAQASALVVVGFVADGMEAAAREVDVPGLCTRVVLDPGHRAFAGFRAVAFPTAYVLDARRGERHVSRGYGPHFLFRVDAALRWATGALDQAGFRARLDGGVEEATPEQRRELRVCGLVRAMARAGRLEEALDTLEDLLVTTSAPAAASRELAVRLRLATGDAGGARRGLEKLEAEHPELPTLPLLRCRLALDAGDLDAAEAAIAGARARLHPEVHLLRGRILEARGDAAAAAALYRTQLERAVYGQDSP